MYANKYNIFSSHCIYNHKKSCDVKFNRSFKYINKPKKIFPISYFGDYYLSNLNLMGNVYLTDTFFPF